METRTGLMKVGSFFYRLRWVLAFAVLGVTAAALPLSLQLETDPSNEAVFERGEAMKEYDFFRETFGSDHFIVIGIEKTPILQKELLFSMKNLQENLLARPQIKEIQSVLNLPRVERKLTQINSYEAAELYLSGKESLEEFSQFLTQNPEMVSPFLNQKEQFAAMVVSLDDGLRAHERSAMIQEVKEEARKTLKDTQVYFSGTAVEQDAFIAKLQHDHDFFVPVTLAVIFVLLAFFQRSVLALFYPASVILATMMTTEAAMTLSGTALNVMTTLVAPVVLIVSVGDVVHIQSHTRHLASETHAERLLDALFKSLWMPCLLTTLTTMAGFLSLLMSKIPAVREFGLFAALGTGLALVWTFALAPVFFTLRLKKIQSSNVGGWWKLQVQKLSGVTLQLRHVILISGLIVFALSLAGLHRTQVETDILGAFQPQDTFRQDTETIHQKLGGVYPLELVLKAPAAGLLSDASQLEGLLNLKQSLALLPGVSQATYLTDVLLSIDRSIQKKDVSHAELVQSKYLDRYLSEMTVKNDAKMKSRANSDLSLTRMSLFLTLSSTAAVEQLSAEIQNKAEALLPAGWSYFVTGQTYLLARMSQGLVAGEIKSVLAALAAIWILLTIFFRSLKAGVVSLFVNLVPLTFVFALMPALGIKLNTATAMIGAVAVGLIVDSTIHVLFRFYESGSMLPHQQRVEHVMNYCAQPMVAASIILAAGFSVTLFGSIRPTVEFGVLMVLAIISALAANLFLLPAVLLICERKNVK